MAGHNKWSKIKYKKGAADAKRAKVWTKIIREITVAARGGQDPSANPRLRKAIDDAKAVNMPKDNIERAVSKGAATLGEELEELVYEGYGPGGVAIVVECLTDNRNRTLSDVRTIIQKKGGSLGSSGSVLFGFKKKGQLLFDKNMKGEKEINEEHLLDIGIEFDIEDIFKEGENFIVTCSPKNYFDLKEAYIKSDIQPIQSEITLVPQATVRVSGENLKNILAIVEGLEENDDVQHVYTNMDADDKELEELLS